MRRGPFLRFRDQVANDVLIAGAEYAGGVHVGGLSAVRPRRQMAAARSVGGAHHTSPSGAVTLPALLWNVA